MQIYMEKYFNVNSQYNPQLKATAESVWSNLGSQHLGDRSALWLEFSVLFNNQPSVLTEKFKHLRLIHWHLRINRLPFYGRGLGARPLGHQINNDPL